jgi:hypothetical protein
VSCKFTNSVDDAENYARRNLWFSDPSCFAEALHFKSSSRMLRRYDY